MQATGWWGGSPDHPVYGLAITKTDRDNVINPDWEAVELLLGDTTEPVVVPLSDAFWRSCSEFRHPAIRSWFESLGIASWPKGNPPSFAMRSVGDNQFTVRPVVRRSLV